MDFLISSAYAQDAATGGSIGSMLLPMLVIFGAFYFLLIRPQQKRQKEHAALVSAIDVDNEVLTSGGIFGVVKGVDDHYASLEIAENVVIKVQKSTITQVLPKGSIDAA